MRILFAGSPDIAVPSLEAMAAAHEVVGVLTNPPAPSGRGLALAPTPVARRASELLPDVPILSPARLGPEERGIVAALRPELLVVYAYGKLFGPRFLALFPRGGLNVHPSLLPRWRGCAPIPYAILHRDERTGISVQRVALQMDSGDILGRLELPLTGEETTGALSEWAALEGSRLLASVVADMEAGRENAVPQDPAGATYCSAISKEDGLIDWSAAALDIHAKLRAFTPWPGAWTTLKGERLAVLSMSPEPDSAGDGCSLPGTVLRVDKSKGIMVKTGMGLAALRTVQLQGKKALPFKDFVNGVRGIEGSLLGA